MKTFIIKRGGKVVTIKNLGWLLRNWKKVESIGFNYHPADAVDGQLVAKLSDGTAYFCDYCDLKVCLGFLNRPVFRGLPFKIVWNWPQADKSWDTTIGSTAYILFHSSNMALPDYFSTINQSSQVS